MKRKKKNKQKPLKIRIRFNENISQEEADKLWFRLFDMLLAETQESSKDKGAVILAADPRNTQVAGWSKPYPKCR